MRSTLVALAILVGLFFASRGSADAALRVCNSTSEPVSVAIAAVASNATGVSSQSEGWFEIDSGVCQIVIDTNLDLAARYYLFAKATRITWAGSSGNSADAMFCTNFSGRFHYEDRPASLCTGAGQQMMWFISEPITKPDWTVSLNTPT